MKKNISFINFRTLADDRYSKSGLIYRTGTTYNLEDEDILYLEQKGIKTFFDFRSRKEIEKNDFSQFLINSNIQYINLPIEGYHEKFKKINYPTYKDYADYYIDILSYGKNSFSSLLNYMASVEKVSPIMYGCSAGKDRTGVFSYLLLKILSASDEEIEEDYVLTKSYLLSDKDFFNNINKKDDLDFNCRYCTQKETIQLLEININEEFKGWKQYMNLIGIDKNKRLRIKKRWGK